MQDVNERAFIINTVVMLTVYLFFLFLTGGNSLSLVLTETWNRPAGHDDFDDSTFYNIGYIFMTVINIFFFLSFVLLIAIFRRHTFVELPAPMRNSFLTTKNESFMTDVFTNSL